MVQRRYDGILALQRTDERAVVCVVDDSDVDFAMIGVGFGFAVAAGQEREFEPARVEDGLDDCGSNISGCLLGNKYGRVVSVRHTASSGRKGNNGYNLRQRLRRS